MSIINDLLYSLTSTKPKDAAFVFDDTRYGFDRGLWKKIQLLGNIFMFDDVRRGFDKGVWTNEKQSTQELSKTKQAEKQNEK